MIYPVQLLRSLVFNICMYVAMLPFGIGFLPWAMFSRRGARMAARSYCKFVIWMARWMIGLKVEYRGEIPQDEVLIAAKHQSFFDVICIFGAVPAGKFIMKAELRFAPIVGQYGLMIGCIPVNRGKRTQAIKKMVTDVAAGRADPGQLIIYPQGTRTATGVVRPYKVGTGVLYQELQQDCVPVALNVGVFWPKRGILRKPGQVVVEFLPRIKAGKPIDVFMAELEQAVETRSNELMAAAGFVFPK